MRKMDAVTVATGLVHLPALLARRRGYELLILAVDSMTGSTASYISGENPC